MNDCFSCGKCCHNHSIMITFEDIRQIHKNRPDIFLPEIITIFEVPSNYEDRDVLEEFHPMINIEENGRLVQGYLGLRFRKINEDYIEDVCPLFDEISNNCTIHDFKPMSCKVYPHYLLDGKIYWNKGRCLEEWDIKEESKDEVRNLIKKAKEQHFEFIKEVEEWNKIFEGKTQQEFFDFIFRNEE